MIYGADGSGLPFRQPMPGGAPWWFAFDGNTDLETGDMVVGDRGLVIRSFSARLGGVDQTSPSFSILCDKIELGTPSGKRPTHVKHQPAEASLDSPPRNARAGKAMRCEPTTTPDVCVVPLLCPMPVLPSALQPMLSHQHRCTPDVRLAALSGLSNLVAGDYVNMVRWPARRARAVRRSRVLCHHPEATRCRPIATDRLLLPPPARPLSAPPCPLSLRAASRSKSSSCHVRVPSTTRRYGTRMLQGMGIRRHG